MLKNVIRIGFILLLLLIGFLIMKTSDITTERYLWPETTYSELFKYEHLAETYYNYTKEYTIEVDHNGEFIEAIRYKEKMVIPRGSENHLESIREFYNQKELDYFNEDIVDFNLNHGLIGNHDTLTVEFEITIKCQDIDADKHRELNEFLGYQSLLNNNKLAYELFINDLVAKGFQLLDN